MIEEPQVLGVDNFGESELTIKMIAKTFPLKKWEVARELRRRIEYACDQKGIEIPFPQRTLWIQKGGVVKTKASVRPDLTAHQGCGWV